MNERLKLFLPFLVFLFIAAVFLVLEKRMGEGSYDPSALPSALLGMPLPAFELTRLEDAQRPARNSDLLGEPALLNVWATWCIACRAEHPYLNRLAEKGVNVFGVNYKDVRADALAWLDRLGNPYQFSVFDNEGRLGLDLGVYGAPETFVIDAQGVVRYRHVGVLSERVWREKIAPLALWPNHLGILQ
ncbi:MAG: DsbE family thiol:disulfide interchange protein [Pseudomonadales bacterium]|nr:DsbE family thiol:disulfide interchange protein [Pseudomonadales bacterium]